MPTVSLKNPSKGSAEYVLKKLHGENQACKHAKKLQPGPRDKVPYRLGFFFQDEPHGPSALDSKFGSVLNLDVSKLCRSCYEDAVPEGYVTWSMNYEFPKRKKHTGCCSCLRMLFTLVCGSKEVQPTRRYGYLPAQYIPGAGGKLIPYQRKPSGELKPFANSVFLPEAFAFLKHLGGPFYLDVLHLSEQWDFNAPRRKQKAQLERVGKENGLAYDFAKVVYVADASGGYGKWTAGEQRRTQHKLRVIPSNWRDAAPGVELTESERWSIVPTIPHGNYGREWPTEPTDNPDSRPLKESIKHQIRQQPNAASSYLTNAEREIERYYRENPTDRYNYCFKGTQHEVNRSRWPEKPEHPVLRKDQVDEVNGMMGPGHLEQGEWEAAKFAEESARHETWEKQGGLSEIQRIEKIRQLYKRTWDDWEDGTKREGVPERLWPPLPSSTDQQRRDGPSEREESRRRDAVREFERVQKIRESYRRRGVAEENWPPLPQMTRGR